MLPLVIDCSLSTRVHCKVAGKYVTLHAYYAPTPIALLFFMFLLNVALT